MKRAVAIVIGLAVIPFLLAGVASAQKAPKDMQVVLIVKDLVNPFFVEMKWAGQAAAKPFGLQCSCLAPEKYTVDNQIRIMEDQIQKKVDAIVLVPIDGKGIVSGIERANKAGVPVFNCNTRAEGGELLGFAGIDHVAMGRTVAQYVADRLKGQGQIVILEGTTGASTAIERLEGIQEIFKKYPGIKVLASTTAKYNRQTGMKVMEDLLIRFPKIDAVIGINDAMALGAKEAIKDAKRLGEMFVCGIDTIPEALDAIRSGEMAASVDSNGFGQAFTAVDLTCQYLVKKQRPPKDTKVGSGLPTVITKDNLKEFFALKTDLYKKYGLEPPKM